MTIYYLYVKTHKITGLKYLGYTGKVDPYKYLGSGEYWTKHLIKHGKEIATEILHECQSKVEIKERGLYYSELWNIVNARDIHGKKVWANLKLESGDGGQTTFGDDHIMRRPEVAAKVSGDNHYMRKPEYDISTHPWKQTKYKKDHSTRMSGNDNPMKRQDVANKFRGDNHPKNRPGARHFDGEAHSAYDHTIHCWEHIVTGTVEYLTQWQIRNKYNLQQGNVNKLLTGTRKTHKGWRVFTNGARE